MPTPSLHISLLCFNRLDLTKACLASLEPHTPPHTLTLTNNASTDGTREWLDQWARSRPWVRVVHNDENLGYKEPHDAVWRDAMFEEWDSTGLPLKLRPEYLVILNNDLHLGPGWFERALCAFERDDKLAIAGSSTGTCSRLNADFHGRPAAPNEPPEYIEGSLLILRVALLAPLFPTLFAPQLQFIYGEDSDLSLRARERGLHIASLDLGCHHQGSSTIKTLDAATRAKISRCQAENHEWLKRRWSVYLRRRDFRYQVLVTRKHALGDVIDVSALLPALKEKWPACEIRVQSDFPAVFADNPHVKGFWGAGATPPTPDYHIDLNLAYERRPTQHTLAAYAKVADVPLNLSTALPTLHPSPDDWITSYHLLPRARGDKWAILHPGPTHWPGKDWPLSRWHMLASALQQMGYKLATVGLGDLVANTLDLRARTSVHTLYTILKRADLFIGLDSGPSHVAQAALTPSLILFGTVWAHLKLFPAAPAIGVQASIEDAPCVGEHHRLPPPIERSSCEGACMAAISREMILAALERLPR